MTGFHCSCCGEWHDELPLDVGYAAPDLIYTIPAHEWNERVERNLDFCTIDNMYYFVRGVIELPIIDSQDSFVWGVWASLSEKNFKRTVEPLDVAGREQEPPYFGWLCNEIPHYEVSTYHLKTHVHTQPVGMRPKIELEPNDHPLAIEQRQGITLSRVQLIVEAVLPRPFK
ncbi:MAG: DUF2199 domain-containing protein [Caldilineaceae bacterium]